MDRKKINVLKRVRKFLEKVKKTTDIEQTIIFGSRITGQATESSDVDILIISRDFENKKSYKRSPKFYLLWNLPYDVDIICLTPEEFKKKKKQIGIIKQAVEEGIRL